MLTLRLFCNVARHQSFSRAAAENGITQSAASQRIGALEKRLGTTLLDRSVRPLALTDAGRLFFDEVTELIQRYDRLVGRLEAMPTKPPAGHVRIDAIYSAGVDLLRHIEKAFAQQYPQVHVEIRYRRSNQVHDNVRDGRCDLGIISYPDRRRDVVAEPLRDELMGVVCAPNHPLAQRDKVPARDLDGWSMVAFEPDLPVARNIKNYLRDHGVEPDTVNVFDNIDTIKSAVAGTDRLSILPSRTVLREVAAGVLAVVELEPELVRPLGIIHRKSRGAHGGRNGNGNGNGHKPFSPAVQAFFNFLLEHAGPHSDVVDEAVARGSQMVGGKV